MSLDGWMDGWIDIGYVGIDIGGFRRVLEISGVIGIAPLWIE